MTHSPTSYFVKTKKGVSVRKRVIKILRDLCLEVKDFPFIGNACIRIIKRVNDDEEGIKKLVLEVFSKLWFTPIEENELDPESWKQQLNMKVRRFKNWVSEEFYFYSILKDYRSQEKRVRFARKYIYSLECTIKCCTLMISHPQ